MHLCLPPYAVKIYMMWIKIQHGTVLFIYIHIIEMKEPDITQQYRLSINSSIWQA